jgi:hypothetical protein
MQATFDKNFVSCLLFSLLYIFKTLRTSCILLNYHPLGNLSKLSIEIIFFKANKKIKINDPTNYFISNHGMCLCVTTGFLGRKKDAELRDIAVLLHNLVV